MLETLLTELPDLVLQYGHYMAVLMIVLLLASGFGLPLPEDIPLIASGLLCHMEVASLWVMLPATFIAVLGADCVLYVIGRKYGHLVPRMPLLRRYLTPMRLAAAERQFQKHGGKTLFISRFLPGVRAAVFFSAGVFKIPFWKMIAFDGSAALLSVPLLVLLGYFGGGQIERVRHLTGRAQMGLLVVIVLVVGTVVAVKYARRNRAIAAGDAGAGDQTTNGK